MQKRAYDPPKRYPTRFAPLPADREQPLYYDRASLPLPYAEDIPYLHYHDRYELGICDAGEGLFVSNGAFYALRAGDLIFIPPDTPHYSRSLTQADPCLCRFVYLSRQSVDDAICAFGERPDVDRASLIPAVIRPTEHPHASELLAQIHRDTSKGTPSHRTAALRVALLLMEAKTHFPMQDAAPLSPIPISERNPVAEQTAEFLSLHYNEAHSATELANMHHLSESQLRRLFIRAYGIPPIAYRNGIRLRIASELLLCTEFSVAEISERVGFLSPSDFYRAFRSHYGHAPSEHRKKATEK